MTRVAFILVFSLGIIVGCTLSDPKSRPITAPAHSAEGDKINPEGDRRPPPPRQQAPSEPDGLPNSTTGTTGTTNPNGSSPALGTLPPADGAKPADKKELAASMDLNYPDVTTEFFNVVAKPFRYSSARPEVTTTTRQCRVDFGYNLDSKTANKYLGVITVKVEDDSWKDFSVGILAQSNTMTKITETSDSTGQYHNLTIEEIKQSGEKQRVTIQYLFANNKREVRAVTFERGLTTNEHRDLVCVATQPIPQLSQSPTQ